MKLEVAACWIAFAFHDSLMYLVCNSEVSFKEGVIPYQTQLAGGGE